MSATVPGVIGSGVIGGVILIIVIIVVSVIIHQIKMKGGGYKYSEFNFFCMLPVSFIHAL